MKTFKELHQQKRGFIMPNAWDAGSAIVLASEGFEAVASTSAGVAFALGKQDYAVSDPELGVSREEMFARMKQIAGAVAVPVNGDLEAGYGDDPAAVVKTIEDAIAIGLAGGNIEDVADGKLYEESLAVERIRAAAARAKKGDFVLTARTDVFMNGDREKALSAAIRRGNLFLEAGADCIFAPGPSDLPTIQTLVKEIHGPLNVVVGLGTSAGNAHALLDAGVQRISLGGSIARAALGYVRRAAQALRDHGTVPDGQINQGELNALFADQRSVRGRLRRSLPR